MDLEGNNERLKQELSTANSNFQRENRLRVECERNINDLENTIKDKQKDNQNLNQELESFRIKTDRLMDDNGKLFSENEKFKQHIVLLTEQNQRVFNI